MNGRAIQFLIDQGCVQAIDRDTKKGAIYQVTHRRFMKQVPVFLAKEVIAHGAEVASKVQTKRTREIPDEIFNVLNNT